MRRALTLAALLLFTGACTGDCIATPPPAERSEDLWLWSSSEVVAAGGAVAFALVDGPPVAEELDIVFGVGNTLQRWDGERWSDHRLVRLCLDFWLCDGDTAPLDDPEFFVEAIGIGVRPLGVGGAMWLGTAELSAGHYRVVMASGTMGTGLTVAAPFELVDGDVAGVPPARPLDGASLVVGPPVLSPEGGTVSVSADANVDRTTTADDHAAVWAANGESAVAQRWDGEAWVDMATVGVTANGVERTFELPALAPGAYRLLVGEVEGRFWVDEDVA